MELLGAIGRAKSEGVFLLWGLSCSFGSLPETSGTTCLSCLAVENRAWGHHGFHRVGSLPKMRMAPGAYQPLKHGLTNVAPEEQLARRWPGLAGEGHAV